MKLWATLTGLLGALIGSILGWLGHAQRQRGKAESDLEKLEEERDAAIRQAKSLQGGGLAGRDQLGVLRRLLDRRRR